MLHLDAFPPVSSTASVPPQGRCLRRRYAAWRRWRFAAEHVAPAVGPDALR
jgi:hypothetical protein